MIREAFALLDLISFFTAGQAKEARARAIRRGTRARAAAGAVHTDMERGFVAAEVTFWEDLVGRRRLRARPASRPCSAWRAATTRCRTATWSRFRFTP